MISFVCETDMHRCAQDILSEGFERFSCADDHTFENEDGDDDSYPLCMDPYDYGLAHCQENVENFYDASMFVDGDEACVCTEVKEYQQLQPACTVACHSDSSVEEDLVTTILLSVMRVEGF